MKSFAQLFSLYRTRSKLTKSAVAESIGTSSVYVLRIEKGQTIPPIFDSCLKLAGLFALTPDEKQAFLTQAFLERIKENTPFYQAISNPTPAETSEISAITASQCSYTVLLDTQENAVMSAEAVLQKIPRMIEKLITDFNYTLHTCTVTKQRIQFTLTTSPNMNIHEYIVGLKQFCAMYIVNEFPKLKDATSVWKPDHIIQTVSPTLLKKKLPAHKTLSLGSEITTVVP